MDHLDLNTAIQVMVQMFGVDPALMQAIGAAFWTQDPYRVKLDPAEGYPNGFMGIDNPSGDEQAYVFLMNLRRLIQETLAENARMHAQLEVQGQVDAKVNQELEKFGLALPVVDYGQ